MLEFNFNEDDTEQDGDFPILPEGTYSAKIARAEVKESKSTPGNKYLNFGWEITDAQHAGRWVWSMQMLPRYWPGEPAYDALNDEDRGKQDSMRKNLAQFFMKVLGEVPTRIDLRDLAGAKARVVVVHDQYQGNVTEKVKKVLKPSDEAGNFDDVPF